MWKKWKESEFVMKLKKLGTNRTVYLSGAVILLAMLVVFSVTAASNRSRRGKEDPTDPNETTTTEQNQNNTTENPGHQDTPTFRDVIPELGLPASGNLIQRHSVDVQVFSKTMNDYRVHLGIDIATEENAPVFAAADGTVSQIWDDPMMGWCVAVSHSGECVTVYKNLDATLAEGLNIGTEVKSGQLLGHVGESALLEIAEEPHLHMEMTVKGLQVDPMEYFGQAVIVSLTEDDIYENEDLK